MIRISGLKETVEFLNRLSQNIGDWTTEGAYISAVMIIKPEIERLDPNYARTLYIQKGHRNVIVGPSISYAPLKEMGSRARFVTYACPWWKYLGVTLRKRVPASPVLKDIIDRIIPDFIDTVVRYIQDKMRGV